MEPESHEPVRLTDVLRRIMARKLVLVSTIVAIVGIAAGVGTSLPKTYTATAVVTVSPITTTPFSSSSLTQQINIETERNVMASTSVAADAAELLRDDSKPASLLSTISVSSPPDSLVLRVSYVGPSPERAAQVANAFADAYLKYRAAGAEDVASRIIQSLEDSIESIAQGDDGKGLSEAAKQAQIVALRQQQQQLSGVSLDTGRVIGPASVPTEPSSPGLPIFIVGGLALGVLAGLALALLVEQFDPRVRRADRLAEATGRTVLATAGHADDEPYRRALRLMTAAGPDEVRPRPLLITVMAPGSSSAWAAHALCSVAADTGRSVDCHILTDTNGAELDRGWPEARDLHAWDADLGVLDVSGVSSATRRELLAERAHAVMVVCTSKSRLTKFCEWLDDFERDGGQVDVILYERKPRPAHATAAGGARGSSKREVQGAPQSDSDLVASPHP